MQERTKLHNRFQDQLDRLADDDDMNQILEIAHAVIRQCNGETLAAAVLALSKDGIEIPEEA